MEEQRKKQKEAAAAVAAAGGGGGGQQEGDGQNAPVPSPTSPILQVEDQSLQQAMNLNKECELIDQIF